ncbi:MAG: flagellar export chaperone FliS [Deltaproteobacteria bacterium]|nr:flagellar export chaperone FliS [Deltaproteobacteria bacterium]
MRYGHRLYKDTQVKTAEPKSLILLLYDGAISRLEQARRHLKAREWYERDQALGKARAIISELLSSLNLEAGPIARSLSGLYAYMLRRLLEAGLQNEDEPVEEVLRHLRELREAWQQILQRPAEAAEAGSPGPRAAETAPTAGATRPVQRVSLGTI